MANELRQAIETRSARLAVIGLGYVGLPVSCLFARAGFRVTGIDVLQDRVALINRAVSPIQGKEPGLDGLLTLAVQSGRLQATTDYAACQTADVVLIAVETPVDDITKKPRYAALRSALASLGQNLKRSALVIVESTIAPTTMENLVKPTLEAASGLVANRDFHLAHCPERLMPGRLIMNIETMPRVVGGMTPEAAELAASLYRHIVKADLDLTDSLTAELVKTTENAYRDVQIAFANETALICEAIGGDIWRVRELVNKSPGRNVLLPGAGVGGHCIPKDPWLLVSSLDTGKFEPRLIPAARAVNDGMPRHMAALLADALREAGRALSGSIIAVLGYAYLENSDDTRNSPSAVLVDYLNALGAKVRIHDPHVPEYKGDLTQVVQEADAVVLMVAHDAYRQLNPSALVRQMRTPVIVDGRRVLAPVPGVVYRCIGSALS